MTIVLIPEGEFMMGSPEGEGEKDEHPQHTVYLDAYWIDQTDVTNAMFSAFIGDTSYQTYAEEVGGSYVFSGSQRAEVSGADWAHPQGPSSSIVGLDDYPVVNVSWGDAQVYCEWAGRRLPTEAEWEKAARGTGGLIYPWGNSDPTSSLANYGKNIGNTTAVGSYPDGASPYGVLDMAGNVFNWMGDWYDSGYYANSPDRNPQGPSTGEFRVTRGGSWHDSLLRTANRDWHSPLGLIDYFGFRCALTGQ